MRKFSRWQSERGTVYIAVLGVTLIVAIMASVAMSLVRIERRTISTIQEQQQARHLAKSAAEFGINYLQQTSSWRSAIPNETEQAMSNWSDGQSTWQLSDSDGNLQDDLRDHVVLSGIGRVGDAVFVESAKLMPVGMPLTCLEVAVLSNDTIALPDGNLLSHTRIESNQIVASNTSVNAGYGFREIDAGAEAVVSVYGAITGTRTAGAAPRQMPNENAFDYYLAVGTWIPIDSLPVSGGKREISRRVLSPASNPFGATNPEGIYVVDCQGQTLVIERSRLVGTLVVLNPGPGSGAIGGGLYGPAVANYPAFLVDGDFTISTNGLNLLSELLANFNYNPIGTPYQGSEDNDMLDSWPSLISGLVYVSGATYVDGDSTLEAGLITGDLFVDSGVQLTVHYNDVYFENPPPGFAAGSNMQVIPGSWQRLAY